MMASQAAFTRLSSILESAHYGPALARLSAKREREVLDLIGKNRMTAAREQLDIYEAQRTRDKAYAEELKAGAVKRRAKVAKDTERRRAKKVAEVQSGKPQTTKRERLIADAARHLLNLWNGRADLNHLIANLRAASDGELLAYTKFTSDDAWKGARAEPLYKPRVKQEWNPLWYGSLPDFI